MLLFHWWEKLAQILQEYLPVRGSLATYSINCSGSVSVSPKARMELITAGQNQVNQQLILDIRGNKGGIISNIYFKSFGILP